MSGPVLIRVARPWKWCAYVERQIADSKSYCDRDNSLVPTPSGNGGWRCGRRYCSYTVKCEPCVHASLSSECVNTSSRTLWQADVQGAMQRAKHIPTPMQRLLKPYKDVEDIKQVAIVSVDNFPLHVHFARATTLGHPRLSRQFLQQVGCLHRTRWFDLHIFFCVLISLTCHARRSRWVQAVTWSPQSGNSSIPSTTCSCLP